MNTSRMTDESDDSSDVVDESPPPTGLGEESYRGEPAADFENSRADGVNAFKLGIGLGGGGYPPRSPAGKGEAGGGSGSLWAAWSDAASKGGVKPMDFSFLMPPGDTSVDKEQKLSPRKSLEKEEMSKKRTRMDVEGDEAEAEPEGSRGSSHVSAMAVGSATTLPPAPRPPQRPQEVYFGKVPDEDRGEAAMDPPIRRHDVFAWMRGDEGEATPEIIQLLTEENQYAQACQRHLEGFRELLYGEMMGHQKEAEEQIITPYEGGYGYYTKTFVARSYSVHYRKRRLEMGCYGDEEFVLDENEIATDPATGKQRPYCKVNGPHPDPSHQLFAYGTDFAGNDSYTLYVRSFGSSQPSSVGPSHSQIAIKKTDGGVIWGSGRDRFYYLTHDKEFRQHKCKVHMLGDDPTGSNDRLLYEEKDRKFSLGLDQTGCSRFMILTAQSAETSEVYLLDLQSPDAGWRRVAPRVFGHSYGIDHRGGYLYVVTNKDGAKNCKLCRFPLAALPDVPPSSWEDVWLPGQGMKLESHCCFQDFMAFQGRESGMCTIWVHNYGEGPEPHVHAIVFPDAAKHTGRILTPRGAMAARTAYQVGLGANNVYKTEMLRYWYASFTVPGITYDYHVPSRRSLCLHIQEAPNFDPTLYRAERITSTGRGVPISLVYRKDIHANGLQGGPFPMLLTGYGAYGASQDPDFCSNRLSLLDRGMIYAVAHIRGGGEFGREWQEQGKNLLVKNRFADFVDAADTLVNQRITTPERLCAWGTSSGGLLVTASSNLRPDLFRAVLLEVPFVDALNTMADPSIPLTVGEWEEIGNPNEKDYFYYMLEYSPYENIRMQTYPAALVTASLNDAMVGFWEPLKYVSKLRALKLDNRPVLLQTDFNAGHGATSDRYQGTREAAFQFAFLLDQLGLVGAPVLPTPAA